MQLFEDDKAKIVKSPEYNTYFRKIDGLFLRWGKTKEDDPNFGPYSPEIADIEVTTICSGVKQLNGVESPCSFCYKSNTKSGKNMSFETFKTALDKFPKVKDKDGKDHWLLSQVAFGADSHATSNPDLWKMMEYCREVGITPNITVADISDETADKLAHYCGAVACSRYANKDLCYDSVKKLTDRGMTQCNIHMLVCAENEDMVYEILRDSMTDSRLEKLNAIVLLSLKKKGRGVGFNKLPLDRFKKIVDFVFKNNISIGFDSCSCNKLLSVIKDRDNYKQIEMMADPCESSCFSIFLNVDAKALPCSFSENTGNWDSGLDVVNCEDFIKDVWNHEKMVSFRNDLYKCDRNCPIYDV